MRKSEMVCSNCINGQKREIGGVELVNCFLNPEQVMKHGGERCAQGDWRNNDNEIRWWGGWDDDDERV